MSKHSGWLDRARELSSERESSSIGVRSSVEGEAVPELYADALVGRYRLLCPIAAGGMAQVWAAKPESGGLARTVAIKVVLPKFAADEEYARMFVDEAMVASAIHHPNVCEIFELGREKSLLFMVLEWIAGDSLAGLLQKDGRLEPLPDEIGARIIAEACAGLHAAHEALASDGHLLGIVHRDISPPNILISLHGHVKVSDFGVAKARHQLHARTRTGAIKGKFAYVPPEQILGKHVDRRADVYAMGCVLYVATLGWRPFGHGAKALGKIVQGKYPLPSELRGDYPRELEAIIVRALSTDREQRFATAEEMRMEIEHWLQSRGQPVVHADIARIVRERISPDRQKLIEMIRTWNKAMPDKFVSGLLGARERMETPTADAKLAAELHAQNTHAAKPKKAVTLVQTPSESDATVIDQRDVREIQALMAAAPDSKHLALEESQGRGQERPRPGPSESQAGDDQRVNSERDSLPTVRPSATQPSAERELSAAALSGSLSGSFSGAGYSAPPASDFERRLRPYRIAIACFLAVTMMSLVIAIWFAFFPG